MNIALLIPTLLLFQSFAHAWTADEVKKITDCHNAIVDKSKGATEKLNFDPKKSTPILLIKGDRYYFLTEQSIFASTKTFPGHRIAYRLNEDGKVLEGEVAIKADGTIGSFGARAEGAIGIELADLAKVPNAEMLRVEQPKVLKLFTEDIAKRIGTMRDREQYNNKAPNVIQSTRDALEVCRNVDAKEVREAVAKMAPQFGGTYKPTKTAPKPPAPKTGAR